MPVLSRFYGIIIRMYFQQSDHNPPHIHAIYGEHVARSILELEIFLTDIFREKPLNWSENGLLNTNRS